MLQEDTKFEIDFKERSWFNTKTVFFVGFIDVFKNNNKSSRPLYLISATATSCARITSILKNIQGFTYESLFQEARDPILFRCSFANW